MLGTGIDLPDRIYKQWERNPETFRTACIQHDRKPQRRCTGADYDFGHALKTVAKEWGEPWESIWRDPYSAAIAINNRRVECAY